MKFSRSAPAFSTLLPVLALALLSSCASAPPIAPAALARPRLVVFLVVDGLPQRQVTDYRAQLAPDGLARFLDRGAWFANAHHTHAFTVTCAGHAALLSGASPQRTGIIGNDWRDPATGEVVYCAGDNNATYIGHKTNALDGTSPKNLRVETLGDVLRRADGRSKVIAVSGKDRGAILSAGRSGSAYMYMGGSGQFASSTYYMAEHPSWVNDFNQQKPADQYFRAQWKPLLPEAAYARSLADGQPWFGVAGGKLPMVFASPDDDAPGPRFYQALLRGPFVDALTLDFACAAIAGEQLGQDDAPDLLVLSLSGHDYVNHAFSAESRLSHDHLLQLDRLLQSFFRELDAKVGPDNYLAVLSADHGFMPAPEVSAAQGLSSGRINSTQVLARLNLGLDRRFGEGKWVPGFSASSVLFNKALAAQKKVNLDALADEAKALLLAEPGFAAAYTRKELTHNTPAGSPLFEQMRKSWHPEVSGDVQYALKPNWMFGSGSGATHGSPYSYDTQIPMLFYGRPWVKSGRIDGRAEAVDIAPTLANLLGLPAPSASEGRVVPLAGP